MNLSDLVTIQNTAVSANSSKNKTTTDKITELVKGFESFIELTNSMKIPKGSIDYKEISKSVQEAIAKVKSDNPEYALTLSNKAEFCTNIYMRDKYENGRYVNYITHDTHVFTPQDFNRTNIDNVRDIANKLGLLIIPYSYTSDSVMESDKVPVSSSYSNYTSASRIANSFQNKCKAEGLRAWMVCPLKYYDISAHASDTTFNFFVPDAVSQSFNAVKLIMPMLISMSKQIEQVAGDVKQLQGQLTTLKEQLKEQQKQIDNLQIEINNIQKRQAQEEARRDEEFKALMERQQQIQWAAFDPMLIAIPDTVTDINTYDGRCFIGPAWGPEIDTVLLNLHGLTKNKASVGYNKKVIDMFY